MKQSKKSPSENDGLLKCQSKPNPTQQTSDMYVKYVKILRMNKNNNQNIQVNMPISKRILDIVFSLIIIIATLPFTLLIAILVFIEHITLHRTFASLFYVEKRISQGKPFNLIKFNIFKPRVIEDLRKRGVLIHTKTLEHNGHSLTYMGKLLQKTYIDEFPQFLAILIGDISFVGPRPVNLEVYQVLLDRGDDCKKVIKAGLTGNYQSQKGIAKKSHIELDNEYIDFCRNNSALKILMFDMKIIYKTVNVLFRAEGI
ncbi:MAG: sugar transferase [Patescibacteria group bacterium]|jgi:lipopolysaccharide/colanic/teichoic acid biosynthesis glycosyltransferase|nr:sugar transferase [Patescibacteria group bacterium]